MTHRRFIPLFFLLTLLALPLWSGPQQATAQIPGVPAAGTTHSSGLTVAEVKQVFPGYRNLTPADLSRFKSRKIDLNGDGVKEIIIVEKPQNPNAVRKKATPNQCPCPAPKASKKTKRYYRYLRKYKKALHSIEFQKVRRRRNHLKVWFYLKRATGFTYDKWTLTTCRQLGRYYSRMRRSRIKKLWFINMDDGQTISISPYRCRLLRRYSRRKRKKRFARWRKAEAKTMIPMCPCPKKKKKKRIVLPTASQPLRIVVAYRAKATVPTAAPPARRGDKPTALSAAALLPQLKVIGRLRGDSLRFTRLQYPGKLVGLRLETSTGSGPRSLRTTTEHLYIYDAGNTGRLKQVFQLQTSREGDDNEPGAKININLKFQQMDKDAWLEIITDTYYETPRFNGLLSRKMYKWYQGKYVPLNRYRGILRARSSSTWKKIAPKGGSILRRRLLSRTSPSNVIDGFRNTPWVAGKLKRSIGEWVRVDFMRNLRLLGVAISTQAPTRSFAYLVPNLFRGSYPKLMPPKYLQIKTSSGYKQTAAIRQGGGFTFVRFPTPVQSRYLHMTIAGEYRDPRTKRTLRIKVPPKERALGWISEIVPIFARVRYTASSFELKGTTSMLPWQVGDHRTATAWAEGRKDAGIGEWIQMLFPMPRRINSLTIVNGCRRPGERYILNNRIKEAQLTFSNGASQTITLKDNHKPQKIKIRGAPSTMSVMLTIRSVYKGKIGNTTCLAELRP